MSYGPGEKFWKQIKEDSKTLIEKGLDANSITAGAMLGWAFCKDNSENKTADSNSLIKENHQMKTELFEIKIKKLQKEIKDLKLYNKYLLSHNSSEDTWS